MKFRFNEIIEISVIELTHKVRFFFIKFVSRISKHSHLSFSKNHFTHLKSVCPPVLHYLMISLTSIVSCIINTFELSHSLTLISLSLRGETYMSFASTRLTPLPFLNYGLRFMSSEWYLERLSSKAWPGKSFSMKIFDYCFESFKARLAELRSRRLNS